jgi:hypothetical protein
VVSTTLAMVAIVVVGSTKVEAFYADDDVLPATVGKFKLRRKMLLLQASVVQARKNEMS